MPQLATRSLFFLLIVAVLLSPERTAVAAEAKQPAKYKVTVKGTKVGIEMVPIPASVVTLGSPASEADRSDDEGPQVQVKIEPFWMGAHEITWNDFVEYADSNVKLKALNRASVKPDKWASAVSLPTNIWPQDAVPIYNGLGWIKGEAKDGGRYPVANLTQLNAKQFCKWLSKKTGKFYRLPTEAEWEYAARAGAKTAYHFGDDKKQLEEHAWFFDNSDYKNPDKGHPDSGSGYRHVGTKKPNAWGLYDMHGNVAEWVLDAHTNGHRAKLAKMSQANGGEPVPWDQAINWPTREYPRVVKGGHYDADPKDCRVAARMLSDKEWKIQDPQLPKSIWYCTEAFMVGFRIVRPVKEPAEKEKARYWEADIEPHREVMRLEKQLRVEVKPEK